MRDNQNDRDAGEFFSKSSAEAWVSAQEQKMSQTFDADLKRGDRVRTPNGDVGTVESVASRYVVVKEDSGYAWRGLADDCQRMEATTMASFKPGDRVRDLTDRAVGTVIGEPNESNVQYRTDSGKVVSVHPTKVQKMAMMETFVAKAVGHRGNELGSWESNTVDGAMRAADSAAPKGAEITIRGETTSDGTNHGKGRGRVVAVREGMAGRWQRMDLTEVKVAPDGGVEVCVDPSGDEAAAAQYAVMSATSALCPYCSRSVAMSRGSLGEHRAHGGVCDGAGRRVASFDALGRAVLR